MTKNNRGGHRVPGAGKKVGRPPWVPKAEQRVRVSTQLAPGSRELAKAVAVILDLPGWSHSFEMALDKMIQNDPALRAKLAEIRIVREGVDND